MFLCKATCIEYKVYIWPVHEFTGNQIQNYSRKFQLYISGLATVVVKQNIVWRHFSLYILNQVYAWRKLKNAKTNNECLPADKHNDVCSHIERELLGSMIACPHHSKSNALQVKCLALLPQSPSEHHQRIMGNSRA